METKQIIPDISRLFIGAANEFEVETVFAEKGSVSPDETHEFDEILVLLNRKIKLQIGDGQEIISGITMKEIPAGTRHILNVLETPTKMVIIHPDRTKK